MSLSDLYETLFWNREGPLLIRMLRRQGFRVSISCKLGMHKWSDERQLSFAKKRRAVIITFNCGDFKDLSELHMHAGMLLAPQDPRFFQEILRKAILISQGKL